MGKKRDKKGKYILFYGAGLLTILFLISGCAITSNFQKNSEGQKHLEQGEALLSKGDYTGAIKEDEEVIKLFPVTPFGITIWRPAGAAELLVMISEGIELVALLNTASWPEFRVLP